MPSRAARRSTWSRPRRPSPGKGGCGGPGGGGGGGGGAAEAADVARRVSVLAERVRDPAEAGVRGGGCREEDERPRQADVDPQQPLDPERDVRPERVDDTHERSALPGRPELRRP